VRRRLGSWTRPLAGLLVFTIALAGAAPTAATAEERATPLTQPTLRASANAAAAVKPLPATTALAQAAPAPTATEGGKGFFGTTAGRIALVVMAAGTGYMVYSAFKDNDPVQSVFR
jgi:hypothetical protein